MRKIPQRMCVGCRQMKNKNELLKVVRSPAGEISLDLSGKKPGRGAYICKDSNCLAAARKKRAFARVFSTTPSDAGQNAPSDYIEKKRKISKEYLYSSEIYDQLQEIING